MQIVIRPYRNLLYFAHQVHIAVLQFQFLTNLVRGQPSLAEATALVIRQTAALQNVLALEDGRLTGVFRRFSWFLLCADAALGRCVWCCCAGATWGEKSGFKVGGWAAIFVVVAGVMGRRHEGGRFFDWTVRSWIYDSFNMLSPVVLVPKWHKMSYMRWLTVFTYSKTRVRSCWLRSDELRYLKFIIGRQRSRK